MAVESDQDLAAFFSPDEFGANCILRPKAGGADIPFTGIVSKHHTPARMGSPMTDRISPFAVGAADVNLTACKLLARWDVVGSAKADDTVIVEDGAWTGVYRVRDPQQDGAVCRLILNKVTVSEA